MYSSFSKIQDCLPENFVRCHKSFIVNIKNIIGINAVTNTILFPNNSSCFIGAKYKNEILEVLKMEILQTIWNALTTENQNLIKIIAIPFSILESFLTMLLLLLF